MEEESHNEMNFLDHLEALRWHLVRSIIAILVIAIAAFMFKDIVFDKIILGPMNPNFWTYLQLCGIDDSLGLGGILCIKSMDFTLFNLDMSGQFTTHITVSAMTGLVIGFPYVFWEIWSFVKPALQDKESKYARGIVFWTSFLFMLGVLFGYYLITPLSVNFLGSYQVSSTVANQINLGSYISTVTTITLASGLVFELPILIYFLTKVGLVNPSMLRMFRRHSFIGALVLGAIITPPDITSQLLVTIPLVVLYEVSIFISAYVIRKQEREKL